MNFSTAVGVPITRNIAGVEYSFPRLCLKEYGEVLDVWINEDVASTEDESKRAELTAKIRNEEAWYIFTKLQTPKAAARLVNKSASKGNAAITAELLPMEPEELCELACQIWSRTYLRLYRDVIAPKTEATPAPKAQEPSTPGPTG